MQLFILILGSMLLPKAYALKCNKCIDGGTCQQEICNSTDQCAAMRFTAYMGKSMAGEIKTRSCLPSEQCISGSINFGSRRAVIASKCCATDLCNNQDVPAPSASSSNGQMCYSCTGKMCNGTVTCMGDEDYCISGMGQDQNKMKGCASKSICSAAKMESVSKMLANASCCKGNLCNSARSTGVGLLLLLLPMVSVPLFL